MNSKSSRTGIAAGLSLVLVAVVVEAGGPAAYAKSLSSANAMSPGFALLARSALAAHQRSYRGNQVVAVFGGSSSSAPAAGNPNVVDTSIETYGGSAVTVFCQVIHVADVGTTLRLRETVQSPAQEYFQRDALPTSAANPDVAGAGSATTDLGAGLSSVTLSLLQAHFAVALTGVDSVAGRTADVVTLNRANGSAAARFWLDRASSLPLRREVYDANGRLLRASAFLDLVVSRVPSQHSGVRELPQVTGTRVAGSQLSEMRAVGWSVPTRVGTFDLFDARVAKGAHNLLLHLTYSDGLSSLSIFEQVGRLDPGGLLGWTRARRGGSWVWVRAGVSERVAWSGHGHVYTIVSDVPGGLVDEIVSKLPHDHGHGGFLHRLRHGADRVGSWLNPFA